MSGPYEWHGNGLANGTSITSTGIANTAGNGDTVAYASSGTTGTMVTAGDGVEISGGTDAIKRFDCTLGLPSRQVQGQVLYTHNGNGSSGGTAIVWVRHASGNALVVGTNNGGQLIVYDTTGLYTTPTPTFDVGDKFHVRYIVIVDPTAPTTTNGRFVVWIKNLSDPAWNTTGEVFVDSGYTRNVGVGDITVIRYCKPDVSSIPVANRYERLGWETDMGIPTSATSRAAIEPYFMDYVYLKVGGVVATRVSGTSVSVAWTHPADAPDGVSIARCAGSHTGNDGNGNPPSSSLYDPTTIAGTTILAENLTSSPYSDTGLTPGEYTYWIVRTSP